MVDATNQQYELEQILPSYLQEEAINSIEFVHLEVKNVSNIAPLLKLLHEKLPLNKMKISDDDLEKVNFSGAVSDPCSFLFGEFRQPGVLTNDLVHNRDKDLDCLED